VAVAKGIWRQRRALPDIHAARTSALSPRMFRTVEARTLFVQAARVVLLKRTCWERYGLKPWIEAAARRLHPNKLAIALANKLARIAWAVLRHGRDFEVRHADEPQHA